VGATLIKSAIGVSYIDVAAVNGWPDSQYPVGILSREFDNKTEKNRKLVALGDRPD